MPLISIIIPVYNVEGYLRRCIDSVLAQSLSDFEVILVNDGSTDNCRAICKEYALKDSRIVVINKENGGPSSARNAGLDIAKGEYIGFVDADDYIAADMYSFLYENIREYQADISVCSFYKVGETGPLKSFVPVGMKKYMNKEEAIRTLLSRKYFESYAWNKLFSKSLFDDVKFPENQIFEDFAIMFRLFDKCRAVIYISEPKYYYVQRKGSLINSGFNLSKLRFVEEYKRILDFSRSRGGIYDEEATAGYIISNLWCIYEASLMGEKYKEVIDTLGKNIENYYFIALKSRYIRLYDKLSVILLMLGISPAAAGKLHGVIKYLCYSCRDLLRYKKLIYKR